RGLWLGARGRRPRRRRPAACGIQPVPGGRRNGTLEHEATLLGAFCVSAMVEMLSQCTYLEGHSCYGWTPEEYAWSICHVCLFAWPAGVSTDLQLRQLYSLHFTVK
ncbi:hypothetical protein LEMLEM_LOCUS17008, partial [Lemmus lemmus]